MNDSKDYFEIDNGLLISNNSAITSGSNSPLSPLVDLPVGSLYLRTTGELWIKVIDINIQWERLISITPTVIETLLFQNSSGDFENIYTIDGETITL